jgi:hypothetical protein
MVVEDEGGGGEGTNEKCICKGWNILRFHFKPTNITHLIDEPGR